MSNSGKLLHSLSNKPFKVLKENSYAHTAVTELLRKTDVTDPQLVYIYGPSGCGKSALISNAVLELLTSQSDLSVQFITASEFAAKYAAASSTHRIPEFQKRFRSLNVLVIEDLQSLENRQQTQQELQSVLDEILQQGGRIIVSSTKPPGELVTFHKKLVNRFHGGVCASITALKFQSRLELLELWSTIEQIPLLKKELSLIAHEKELSPRELHALLIQLQTVSRINQQPMNRSFVKQYLEGNIEPPKTSISKITRAVCNEFKISVKEIRSANRAQQFVIPRQCAMHLARELTQDSLEKIALYFNRKNHSTVIHACRQIQNELENSPGLRQQLSRIKQQIGVYLF